MEWRLAGVFSAAPIVRDLQHQPMLKIGQHRDTVPDLWAIGPLSQSLAKACSWKRKEKPASIRNHSVRLNSWSGGSPGAVYNNDHTHCGPRGIRAPSLSDADRPLLS